MPKLKHFLLPALFVCFLSCKNERPVSYAIKDFRKSLQPFLSGIVSEGVVTYHDSANIKSIRDNELTLLVNAENPVLRATALIEMLGRRPLDHFNIVLDHLDDTAVVAVDYGEFGIIFRTVSDYIIEKAAWQTPEERNLTIREVLTKHNYLRSAYMILSQIEPHENYYTYIKDMATRPRRLDKYEGYETGFEEIEHALYGLARFRRKEDVQIIRDKMMEHNWELSDLSFQLMEKFPDTAYFDILQRYHKTRFYRLAVLKPYGLSRSAADMIDPEDFIRALAVQRNDRSAKLLETMLTNLSTYPCMRDKDSINSTVIEQIWENQCPAYARLREKIRRKAEEILNERVTMQLDTNKFLTDTVNRVYHWYN